MALVLTEEQKMLQDAAHDFINENAPVSQLRMLRDSGDAKGYDPALWTGMAEMGWSGIIIPEAYGGIEFGYVGLGIVFQEMGKTLCCSPLLSTAAMCAEILSKGGHESHKQDVLRAIAQGGRIVSLALEEGPRHRADHFATNLTSNGSDLAVSGRKEQVIDGHVADQLIVAAHDPEIGGTTLVLVDADAAGVTRSSLRNLDSRPCARIEFDGAPVAGVIGERGGGQDLLDRSLDLGRLCLAAELLGISEAVFQATVEYLGTRKQFGVPIGSFQALQHRAAQLYCEIELTRSAVLSGFQHLEQPDPKALAAAASLAKAKAADTAREATAEGVQMHGGIGMTDDVDIGLFMKRSRVAETALGDYNYHADRYARLTGF